MVYCGKPSKGCQMCRTRRIKCDETKPTCNQCQKSRRQCPGYKDDFDLVFRNETKATERRARRNMNIRKPNSQISFQASQTSFMKDGESMQESQELVKTESHSTFGFEATPSTALSIPIHEQAPCYFMDSYVVLKNFDQRGYFGFLVPMMKSEKPDSVLSNAFSAVALASLANRPNSKGTNISHQAMAQYSKALKATNLALQDPVQMKTDQTLAAILMLGFFETVTTESTNALAWGSHIDGAAQIVKMRGKKQLRTNVGGSLFVCVREQMTINCMVGSKVPVLDEEWWAGDVPKDDYSIVVTKLYLRVAALRAEINSALACLPRTPEYFQRVLNLMRRAQALEQEYVTWEESLPSDMRPRTVAWVDQIPGGDISKVEVCPGKVEMFRDFWVSHMWNASRTSRLFISGVIVRCAAWICSPVDYRTTPEYATESKHSVDLINDIIASIPFHLGWRVGYGGALRAGDFTGFAYGTENFTSPKALCGFFCMFPLTSIMSTDYITDSQRLWAKGRLEFISDVMGLNHAKVLSTLQLRLPSMIIRRDTMAHSTQLKGRTLTSPGVTLPYPSSADYCTPNFATPGTTVTIPAISHHENASQNTFPHDKKPPPTYTPGQQQEAALQREQWEKDRKQLLKKASNSQGDSVERLMANYLAV